MKCGFDIVLAWWFNSRQAQAGAALFLCLAGASMNAAPYSDNGPETASVDRQIAFYALSRGSGVPAPTQEALDTIRARFEQLKAEGIIARFDERRIGLEGEIRICAVFVSKASARAELTRLERLVVNLELADLRLEACE